MLDLTGKQREKYKWTEQSVNKLTSDYVLEQFDLFYSKIESNDTSDALNALTDALHFVCKKVVPKQNSGGNGSNHPWWDNELENLRKTKAQATERCS